MLLVAMMDDELQEVEKQVLAQVAERAGLDMHILERIVNETVALRSHLKRDRVA